MSEPAAPVALVTGASSGIGRDIALQLAERGYDLLVTATKARFGHAFAQALDAARRSVAGFRFLLGPWRWMLIGPPLR